MNKNSLKMDKIYNQCMNNNSVKKEIQNLYTNVKSGGSV